MREPLALLLVCAACSSGPTPSPATPTDPPSASTSEASESSERSPKTGASAEPSSSPAASEPADASSEGALARDLVKSGGRKIGWSASKKGFVVPKQRRSGESRSLDIVFTDDTGHAHDVVRICQAGECDEQLEELAKKALPKLTERLQAGSYVAVRAIGWPERDELDVSQLGMKLRYAGGRLEGLREGKPAVRLGSVGSGSPKLLAIFPVPDTKLLAGFAAPDGDLDRQDFFVVRVP